MTSIPVLQFDQIVRSVEPPSESWHRIARAHLDTLTKPLGSLGRLEDIAAQIVAIRREDHANAMKKAVYVFAADHGVTEEGVSAYPRAVTHQMVLNFLAQGAAINVLARLHGVELSVVDVGVDADLADVPALIHRKVAKGTRNMLSEPAMTTEEVEQAIAVGIDLAATAVASGKAMIAIGEMGIGNTTCASAITCVITGASATVATGHGTGITPDALAHKVEIVRAIVERHFAKVAHPLPLEVLRCIGGLEIAAMTGMILAAARHKLVIVIDGFISTAAAALAIAIAPNVHGYLIAGHQSEEPGHKLLLEHLDLIPVLSLNMRLGEGSGAVLAMPILESAMALYTEMATFASAGVSGASQ